MLTLFTTAKPFTGQSAVLQKNALKSWTLLHPDVDVILFGDELGASDIARELGIRNEAHVDRFGGKLPYVNSLFASAEHLGRHEILCYVNCDIVLLPDFWRAVAKVAQTNKSFLMVGRRWDIEISDPIDFSDINWPESVRRLALGTNRQKNGWWIDYFVFPRGHFGSDFPRLVIGRPPWDNWTVWNALRRGPVIDASEAVVAIHQNHGYGSEPASHSVLWNDEASKHNEAVAGSRWHLRTIEDATHLLGSSGLRPNPNRNMQMARRLVLTARKVFWLSVLNWTRPIRKAVGLQKANCDAVFARLRRFVSR
jgi:hypothetical protein